MAEQREVKVGQVYKTHSGRLVVVVEIAPDGHVTVAPFEEAVFDTHVTLGAPSAEEEALQETAPAPCAHEGAKWDSQNRHLECPCGARISPGTCIRCGRKAGGTSADGQVCSPDGFVCGHCRGG